MLDNKTFKLEIINTLKKLCADCDKEPSLNEKELQPLPRIEAVEKWQVLK